MKRFLLNLILAIASAVSSFASYESVQLTYSPAVYLRLGETAGASTAQDTSTNNRDATVVGTITFGVTGAVPANTAATFSSTYMTLGTVGFSGANAWTINAWVKRNGDSMQTIFGTGNASTGNGKYMSVFMSVVSPGQIYIGGNGNDWKTGSGVVPDDSNFHMVTVVYDGTVDLSATSLRVYVDAVAQTTTLTGGGGSGGWDGPFALADVSNRVGGNIENPTQQFNSTMDEFSIVHDNLSLSEIEDLYEAATGGGALSPGTLSLNTRTSTSVTLDFETNTGGVPPYSSQLKRATTSGGSLTNVGSPVTGDSITFAADTGRTQGATYYYKATVTDDNADTATSAEFGVYMPTDPQIAHLAASPGFMVHHGLYTWGAGQTGAEDPNIYNPTNLNVDQWLDVAKSMGCKAAAITTRHHDGFCLYPSALTPHTIAASTWYQADPTNRDVVKLFTDATRARGMKVGLYYSIWDKRWESDHPGFTSGQYTTYVCNQLTELMGGTYGTIDYIFTDGWGWSVGYTTVDFATVYAHIKSINPSCILIENSHEDDLVHTDIVSSEEPFDAPPGANNLIPAQTTETIRTDGQWQWVAPGNQTLLSGATIASNIARDASRNSVYHINFSPDDTGVIPTPQVTVAHAVLNDVTPPASALRASAVWTDTDEVTLRWAANGEADLKGYQILRSTSETTGFTAIRTVYGFDNPHLGSVITGLTPGTDYYWRVVPIDWSDNLAAQNGNAPYYPTVDSVLTGVDFGPTGDEFEGTATAGGGSGINGSPILGMP